MSKITLNINMFGLCAFVPNTDIQRSMRVILIDGRAPGLATNNQRHVSHIPSLRFDLADLDERSQQPYYYYCGVKDQAAQGQWIFDGDDLEIRVAGQPLADGPLQIMRNGHRDFYLIPAMSKIYPELRGLNVRPECLSNTGHLTDLGVAARLQLRGGRIGAYAGEQYQYLTDEEFTFTGLTNNYRQRLAACARFQTEIDGDSVEIYSHQLGHGFKFRPANGKSVELTLGNMPPAGLELAKPGNDDVDLDFELLYRIANTMPSQLRVPARMPIGPEYPQPLICSPVIYNAHDLA